MFARLAGRPHRAPKRPRRLERLRSRRRRGQPSRDARRARGVGETREESPRGDEMRRGVRLAPRGVGEYRPTPPVTRDFRGGDGAACTARGQRRPSRNSARPRVRRGPSAFRGLAETRGGGGGLGAGASARVIADQQRVGQPTIVSLKVWKRSVAAVQSDDAERGCRG